MADERELEVLARIEKLEDDLFHPEVYFGLDHPRPDVDPLDLFTRLAAVARRTRTVEDYALATHGFIPRRLRR